MKTKIFLFAMLLMAAFNMNAQMPCNAAFTYTTSPSGIVTFYSSSTTISSSQTFNWSFGNGTYGYGTQVTCAYNTTGIYTVCLFVQDSSILSPCMDSSCQTITVTSAAPCASSFTYAANTSGPANTYDFTSTSTGTGLTYMWYWGDGSPYEYTANATHTFPAAGTYNVSLSVDNGAGCTDSTWQVVSVGSSSPCNASFFVYQDTAFGAPASTYIGVNTSTGAALSYTWIWGDGSPNGSGPYPSHTYPAPGTYNICLVVMGAGCVDSFCINQVINKTTAMYTINFQAPAGVNDLNKDQATLYPNPADKQLFIKGATTTTYHVEIFNLNGSKMLSASVKGNHPMNIATLPSNLYMVKVTDNNGKSEFAKFMKQ